MDLGLSHWQVPALSHPPVPMEFQLAWVNGHCRLTASSPLCCFISPNNTAHSLRSVGFLCSHTRGRVPPSTLASRLRMEGLLQAGGGVWARLWNSGSRNPSMSLLTVGRTLRFQVGASLGQMRTQTRNIFLPPLPPLSSAGGRFMGSWLIGTVPAAPVRNGTLYTTSPGERLPSVHSRSVIMCINYPPSHPSSAQLPEGAVLLKTPEWPLRCRNMTESALGSVTCPEHDCRIHFLF